MNIELRTMKAMTKEWKKRVNEEIEAARGDKDAEAKEGNMEGFWYSKGYIKGLGFALREGDIIR